MIKSDGIICLICFLSWVHFTMDFGQIRQCFLSFWMFWNFVDHRMGSVYWYLLLFCWMDRLFRHGDHSFHNPIVYVKTNRCGWWSIIVVIWPMVSKTWTKYSYSRLEINSASVAIVVSSWYAIIWSKHVSKRESYIGLLMMLQCVPRYIKRILQQFIAFEITISIDASIRTYLHIIHSWYKRHDFTVFGDVVYWCVSL
jgi:hypothetical protein